MSFDYDGYTDGLLNGYMAEQADSEALAEYAKEFVDELDIHDVIDELEARRIDALELLTDATGLDADSFDNDAHKLVASVPVSESYKLDGLRRMLEESIYLAGYPEKDVDSER